MDYKRSERVSDTIRKEICQMLLKEVKDPRIGFVTVTDVEVSDDLGVAKVFYTVLGEGRELKSCQAGLRSASRFIKRELGKRLRMRVIPEIVFQFDESLEYGMRIEAILEELGLPAESREGEEE